MNKTKTLPMLVLLAVMTAGCHEDERVARIATEAANRQARQNEELTRLNREVAEGTRRLVEADAQARRELVVVHQQLQHERGELNEQWGGLENERQEIAQQRRTQSMLVPLAQAVGAAFLAALVIGFCWSLLYGLQRSDDTDTQLAELLVRDIVSEQPVVLPARAPPRAITDRRVTAGADPEALPDGSTNS